MVFEQDIWESRRHLLVWRNVNICGSRAKDKWNSHNMRLILHTSVYSELHNEAQCTIIHVVSDCYSKVIFCCSVLWSYVSKYNCILMQPKASWPGLICRSCKHAAVSGESFSIDASKFCYMRWASRYVILVMHQNAILRRVNGRADTATMTVLE